MTSGMWEIGSVVEEAARRADRSNAGQHGLATAPLGIVAALQGEVAGLLAQMPYGARSVSIGMRDYHLGQLYGLPCVIVLARVGKVAAAATTVTLIHAFGVGEIVFTGVAGSLSRGVSVGDVVVADTLVQHDMDARPLFARFEVPMLGRSTFKTDDSLRGAIADAARAWMAQEMPTRLSLAQRRALRIDEPTVHVGQIASGDQFIGGRHVVEQLRESLPDAKAVEMEGAAVAQVCHEYGVPYAVIRTVSDSADHAAYLDFSHFLREVASVYSHGILIRFLKTRGEARRSRGPIASDTGGVSA